VSIASDTVIVGKVGAPYGVKGWFKVTSYTEVAEGIFDYRPWLLTVGKIEKEFEVEHWKPHNKGFVAKLAGVDDREAIDALKNLEIRIHPANLPDLQDGEFYWRDLIGMSVVNQSGYDFGKVDQLFETGANDVMQVKANMNDAFGQKERMIPVLFDDVIKQVDESARTITVDWDPAF
jgi:16S rRNA processing protein RimM